MNLRPLNDRIVLQLRKRDEKTKGGIFIPETAEATEKAYQANVIAVGPGRLLETGQRLEPRVKAGDVVLIAKYSGTRTQYEGEELVMASEGDVLGVVESDTE